MKKNMEFVGEHLNYKVYRNSDGFLEGYKSKGKYNPKDDTWSNMDRVVTNQTTPAGFEKFIKGMRVKSVKKTPLSELPKLFTDL